MKFSAQASEPLVVFLLLIAAGLLAFYSYVYRREARQHHQITRRQLVMLWSLRILAGLLAVLALARPSLTTTQTEERPPVVPLLLDASSSMGFDDARESPLSQSSRQNRFESAKTAAYKLEEPLRQTHRVRLYTFSDALRLLKELPRRRHASDDPLRREEIFAAAEKSEGGTTVARPVLPVGEHSNIGDSIGDCLRDLTGERIAGLVLLSDGRQTGGTPLDKLAEQAKGLKIPIHAVALGSEFPLRDLSIEDVSVSGEASLGDVLTFHVKVVNQIQDPLTTELTLLEADAAAVAEKQRAGADDAELRKLFQPAGRRNVALRRGQRIVTVSTIPDVEGLRLYRLELPVQPDEVNTENNVFRVSVKVVKRTLRVLLIAGTPSREYRYLTPALLRDPVISLSSWLQSADVDYIQQGNISIDRLPETSKDWSAFDVAILQDVDPNGLSVQQIAGLETMVAKGGGLMIVAGRSQGLAKLLQVHAAKVRGLLPVEIDKAVHPDIDRYYEQPFAVERTPQGKSHPVMLASSDEKLNEQIWATFPKFYWSHAVGKPKPRAVVLLQSVEGGDCLMAIQRYGEGAVFYSGLDSLWLWRYPAESFDYDRFWTRIIRYLGETRLMGTQQQASLSTDRGSYAPGEEVKISLRILDPALMAQLARQTIYATISGTARGEYKAPLTAAPGGEAVFTGTYVARAVGMTDIRIRQPAPNADSEAKPLFDVSHGFQVQMQSLESIDTSADLEAMKALAEATGGLYFDYRNLSRLDELVKAIPDAPQILRRQVVIEVWDGVAFLLIFLALVSAEWSLRKWWGLL